VRRTLIAVDLGCPHTGDRTAAFRCSTTSSPASSKAWGSWILSAEVNLLVLCKPRRFLAVEAEAALC
jgi:hypothetical protein